MIFSKNYSLLAPDFRRLRLWFFVPATIAFVAASLLVLDLSSTTTPLALLALAAAWPATLTASLFAQGYGMKPIRGLALQLAAGLAAAGLVVFGRAVSISPAFFFLGLAGACLAAPVARLKDAGSYWVWVERFCVAAIFAYAAALLGWGAATATLYSADHLFGVFGTKLASTLTADLAAFFFIAVGPIAFLALQPPIVDERLETDEKDFVRRAVAALASWALAPFVLIYSALLWLYAAKIALSRDLPDGQIGWMVSAFGASALATVLFITPQRENGPPQTRLLWRIWPYLTLAPLLLLAVAVYERVAAYGLTPDRYMLALAGAFCAANAVVALGSRESVVRFAPAAGALALIFAAIGPWGALATSTRWQKAALLTIYAAHGRVAEGRLLVSDGAPAMSAEEARRCRAAVDFLDSDDLDGLAPLLAETDRRKLGDARNFCPADELHSASRHLSYYIDPWTPSEEAKGFSILGFFRLAGASEIHSGDVSIKCKDGNVTVAQRDEPPAIFDMTAIARARAPDNATLLLGPILKPTSGDGRFVFLLQNLSIETAADGSAKLDSLGGFLLRRD